MEKEKLIILVTRSTALEGSTLDYQQNSLLLERGISSQGKTIAEQLMNIDLAAAYEEAARMAARKDMINVFRLRNLAGYVLKHSDASYKGNDAVLLRVCSEANEALMHYPSSGDEAIRRASYLAHFRISAGKPWSEGNDLIGRLVMNLIQMNAGLEPDTVPADYAEEYKRVLSASVREDIADVFTDHVALALKPASGMKLQDAKGSHEKAAVPGMAVAAKPEAKEAAPEKAAAAEKAVVTRTAQKAPAPEKPKNKQRILELLAKHPRMTTADLAGVLDISCKGVEKHLAQLKASGALRRIGPDKGGRWEVGLNL